MPITFNCENCGTRYNVRSDLGGKRTKCKKCNQVITIPHDDGLGDLAALDAPMHAPPTPVPPPAWAAADRQVVRPPAQVYQAPRAAPVSTGGGGLGTLKIPDGLNVRIALLLLGLLVAGMAYISYGIGSVIVTKLPPQLQSRMWFFLILSAFISVLQHLLIIAPVAWLCVKAATSFAKSRVLEPSYLLVAGAMACPTIALAFSAGNLVNSVASGHMTRSDAFDGVILILLSILAGLVLAVVLLQALLHMNWRTTLISLPILIPVMLVTLFVVGRYVKPQVNRLSQRMAGLDRESVQEWVSANPQAIQDWRNEQQSAANAKQAELQAQADAQKKADQEAAEARRRADPLYGKTEAIEAEFTRVNGLLGTGLREDVQADVDKLVAAVNALKPEGPSDLWEGINKRANQISLQLKSVPSRELPSWVFEEPETAEVAVRALPDSELGPKLNAFGWSVRLPAGFVVKLGGYEKRASELRFATTERYSPEIVIKQIKVLNPKQKQVFVYGDPRHRRIAEEQLLLAFQSRSARPVLRRLGDRVFFEVQPTAHSQETPVVYFLRGESAWLAISVETNSFNRQPQSLPKVLNLLPTITTDVKDAVDVYSPAEVAKQMWTNSQEAIPILGKSGPEAIPFLQEFVQKSEFSWAKATAESALKELGVTVKSDSAPGRPVVPPAPAVPVTIDEAWAKVDAAAHVHQKRDAIKAVADATFDETKRDEIAKKLEQIMLADDGFQYGEEIAAAMQVWHRPQTVTVLMPLISNQDIHPWLRKPVIKVMAATKDRRAVLPVLRWIIKEPETVVASAVTMGSVVEDEAIKLLTERDNKVRANAARILMQVGTRKCMAPLMRAAKDQRDASAAAVAQSAYEVVKDRAGTTTQPVVAPAKQ